jgi:hypothetical protein
VRDIITVDVANKKTWFSASGMNEGEDPYNIHHYPVNFDGKGMLELTPELANRILTFSSDQQYFIDNYSTVNTPLRTVLPHALMVKKTQGWRKRM